MRIGRLVPSLILLFYPLATFGQWSDKTIFKEQDFISSRNLHEPEGMHYAFLYTNGIRFGSNKKGPFELSGHWQGKTFIYTDPSGKGDIETANMLDNGDLQLLASVFDHDDPKIYVLHRPDSPPGPTPQGQIAVVPQNKSASISPDAPILFAHDPHLVYPPPKGTVTAGMSLDDLKKLRWHWDKVKGELDDPNLQMYIYNSDDPTLVDLVVSVKDGVVIVVNGGNG